MAAHADSIGGYFSVSGSDTLTTSTVTFGGAEVGGTGLTGTEGIGGTFATYLKDGDPVTFLSIPGGLPYMTGTNYPPNPPYTTGVVPLFTVTGSGVDPGETFTFDMTSYTATPTPCGSGGNCLDVTINGTITATAGPYTALLTTSGAAVGATTLQYVTSSLQGVPTTFSGQVYASPVPEPSSLALLGTGLLGVVGIARRKFTV